MNAHLLHTVVATTIGICFTTAVAAPVALENKGATFVKMAAVSDMFETKTSELAAVKGNDADRAFAAQMNAAHQKTSSELSVIVRGHATDWPLPSHLDPMHQKIFDRLDGLEGVAFTKQYREDQRVAHEDAIRLLDTYAAHGDVATLREWAAQTAPKVRMHLEMLRSLAK